MSTRLDLRVRLRTQLADLTQWPDVKLDNWLGSAVRDYSRFFPRELSAVIACATGTRTYSLTSLAGLMAVTLVEYPTGQDPPRYLARRLITANFWGLSVYDLRGNPPQNLVLGESPATGQNIGVTYQALHISPISDVTALTVPDVHLDALHLFVLWQAARELHEQEALTPDALSSLLGSYSLDVLRTERDYQNKIKEFQAGDAPGGPVGPWVMDKSDRVY